WLQRTDKGKYRAETRTRVLSVALPLTVRVGEEFAAELLAQIGPTLDAAPPADLGDVGALKDRATLLERGLFGAAHYGRSDLVQQFTDRLTRLLEASTDATILEAAGATVAQSLRSLRKVGLRDA